MSDINTTPLVDVMLVLLIIFLITIPVVNSSIAVALPREAVAVRPGHGRQRDHLGGRAGRRVLV
jgi:biopolymer transport protein ExbD